MSKRNKTQPSSPTSVHKTWCWRRWIVAGQEELWTERLLAAKSPTWALTERPNRSRLLLETYTEQRAIALALVRRFGGKVRLVQAREWTDAIHAPPTRIGRKLEIVHEETDTRNNADAPRLQIPHGMAFGSGDHGTTHMLLRALTDYQNWKGTSVLDLGTGSGVLALAARLFGARKIVATDFAPDAVRTARQNEALNFPTPKILWRCADVKRLRSVVRYDLVLANLFSGILCEAALPIAGSVAPGGQLWQSGILRSQQEEVIAAYRRQKLELIRATIRGKWVMLQWRKAGTTQDLCPS